MGFIEVHPKHCTTDHNDLKVMLQSSTSSLFRYYLMREDKTDITLTSAVSMDDEIINVSASHGFTAAAGEVMVLRYGDQYNQVRVTSVSTDAITIEIPIDRAYPVEGTTIIRGNVNMNVNGSVTPQVFKYTNNAGVLPIDISNGKIILGGGATAGDDGKFGTIAAISKGMYFRKSNDTTLNLGNYKTNGDFRRSGSTIDYLAAGPAGTQSVNINFHIENTYGQVLRLDPHGDEENTTGDTFYAVVRDDLSGLTVANIVFFGSFTEGENA